MKRTELTGSTRAKLGKYAFFLGSAATLIGRAGAQTVADFTFESSYSTGANGITGGGTAGSSGGSAGSSAGMTSGMLTAEVGLGTAIGVHTSASTQYTFPTGNGSSRAFSSNNFSVGDYYQFTINAANYTNIAISYDQVHSSTGPQDFTLQYSTNGGSTFVNYTSYSLPSSGASSFSSGSVNTAANFAFNLSAITALNTTTDIFRITVADTSDAATTSGSFGSTGTSRIDNFIETGTAVNPIPEPSSVVLLSIAGAGAVLAARRRKSA